MNNNHISISKAELTGLIDRGYSLPNAAAQLVLSALLAEAPVTATAPSHGGRLTEEEIAAIQEADDNAVIAETSREDAARREVQASGLYRVLESDDTFKEGDERRDNNDNSTWAPVSRRLFGHRRGLFDTATTYRRKVAVTPPAVPASPRFVDLDADDVIKAGDEWKLKDGLRHNDGRPVEWRTADDRVIGRRVGEFRKSVFRRAA